MNGRSKQKAVERIILYGVKTEIVQIANSDRVTNPVSIIQSKNSINHNFFFQVSANKIISTLCALSLVKRYEHTFCS